MVSTASSVSSLSRFSSSMSRLSSSKKDDYEGMKIDKSKLRNIIEAPLPSFSEQ
jgi:hypothetical protein